jgi:23S rRNA (cytosine1962-C5)-methyltransferase
MAKPPKSPSRTIQKAPKASRPKAPFVQKSADTSAKPVAGVGSPYQASAGRPGVPGTTRALGSRNSDVSPPAPSRKGTIGAVISRRASERLRNGHLWVYTSDIESLETGPGDPPAILPVADNRGLLLGTALYSPVSQIALRMISRQAIHKQKWLELLSQRLRVAVGRRKHLLNENTNACRLVFSEADDLPGLVIDKYAGIVVVQLLSKGLDTSETRQACASVLSEMLGGEPLTIWERPDPRIRELEGLSAPSTVPLFTNTPDAPVSHGLFLLNGLSFHFDVNSGQKTGAFLDQSQNYANAAAWAQERGARKALDVCTYQGGFALHLARVCSHVTGIDASRSSLQVAELNLEANRKQITAEVDWVEADAFELLRGWSVEANISAGSATGGLSVDHPGPWDLIVLDPPAFAKSMRAVEGALRGYKELNLRALRMLKPGGLLITCSCSHHVSWADLEGAVASAAIDAQKRVTLLERRGAAEDHPVLLNLPETEYLKCLICQVD